MRSTVAASELKSANRSPASEMPSAVIAEQCITACYPTSLFSLLDSRARYPIHVMQQISESARGVSRESLGRRRFSSRMRAIAESGREIAIFWQRADLRAYPLGFSTRAGADCLFKAVIESSSSSSS